MAKLIMRVVDSIWPGRRAARDEELSRNKRLAELRDGVFAEASGRATPGAPQSMSAQAVIGPSGELNNDDLGQLAAEPAAKAAKNAYLTGAVRQDHRRVLRMGLKSPIVWLCLVSAVIAASASVVG